LLTGGHAYERGVRTGEQGLWLLSVTA
jgi:hypothetical protein